MRASIFTASVACAFLLASCMSDPTIGPDKYQAGPRLMSWEDPLAGGRPYKTWNPPKQFAVYVFPHVDPDQGVAIGGHWILMNLTEGSWYFEDPLEREIVADDEMSARDKALGRDSLGDFGDVVVPYKPVNR